LIASLVLAILGLVVLVLAAAAFFSTPFGY
jgi:hypothetical protein